MKLTPEEILLDTCLLEPPEPFVQAIKVLSLLQNGQFLHMIHRKEPLLLYPKLPALALVAKTCQENSRQDKNQKFHIVIWKPSDVIASEGAMKLLQKLKFTSL